MVIEDAKSGDELVWEEEKVVKREDVFDDAGYLTSALAEKEDP